MGTSDLQQFWYTLFNPQDTICWAATVTGKDTYSVQQWPAMNREFFTINPVLWARSDVNVTAFRNILCEFDAGTLAEQHTFIEKSKLPFSTLVYSGNKSLHAIISLKDPPKTIEEYRALAKRVHKKLPGVDTSTSNPSRLSRTPGVIRADTDKEQALWSIRGRIWRAELDAWLGLQEQAPKLAFAVPKVPTGAKPPLSIFAKHFLKWGGSDLYLNRFNSALFKCAIEMANKGWTKPEAFDMLESITGHLDRTDRATINSAYRSAKNGNTD